MWDNSVRRRFWRNIVLAVLSVAALIALVMAMRMVRRETAQEDATLAQVSSERKQQQDESIAEVARSVEAEYHKDLETIATYLPGIVCWGDTLTRGSSGNVSYPDTLQKLINEKICDVYDFGKSISGNVVISGLKSNSYTISIPVVNMGGGDESSETIMGRAGVVPYQLSKAITIPADCTSVSLTLKSDAGSNINPLTVGDLGMNPVSIDGIEGTLAVKTVNRKLTVFTFTRLTPGEEKRVEAGTPVVCASNDAYKDYVHVIWLGTYDGFYKPEELVQHCRDFISRQTANTDRYLIISPCVFRGEWEKLAATTYLENIDTLMLREFGENYIALRKYLISDGLSDAGLSGSGLDKKACLAGAVPNSFRSTDGSLEFTSVVYTLVGKLVYERMDRLGFFDEIREELEISTK